MSRKELDETLDGLDWQELLAVSSKLLAEESPFLSIPLRKLRDKARQGEVPTEALPVMVTCLMGTDDPQAIAELAKGLAAFGRAANIGAAVLAIKLEHMTVLDDADFWAFDGALNALGYIAVTPSDVEPILRKLCERLPIIKAGVLYQGTLEKEEREQHFLMTIARIQDMLAAQESSVWREKKTDLSPKDVGKSDTSAPAWRVGF